jgi:hypothetical protein
MGYPFFATTAAALLVTASLGDCAFLTRFEQESYDCSRSQAPFTRLVFNKTTKGAHGIVEGGSQSRATITEATEAQLLAQWGDDSLSINRESGVVTVTQANIVRSYPCKKASFKM